MSPLVLECPTALSPESLVELLHAEVGVVLLRSLEQAGGVTGDLPFESVPARYSFVAARPFLTLRSAGSRCALAFNSPLVAPRLQYGNPWRLLDSLMARYELLDAVDLPFPLGGCFGYWGYDLKNFVEPRLPRHTLNDLELPDCHVGFYDSLVAFDHQLGKTWVISTGLSADGSRSPERARARGEFWKALLGSPLKEPGFSTAAAPLTAHKRRARGGASRFAALEMSAVNSNLSRSEFIARVEQAQRYIRAGDIYQVNLSQRLSASCEAPAWALFRQLSAVSPAPFAAFLHCGDFQIASSSPELFLRLSGPQILTRPIKGTRPRSADPTRDAQFTYELQTSAKEMAELVMITDLLRNDLGKVCEFGSVQVPELIRLERYPQVQHLVSTVAGRLRPGVSHFAAFASCFPGGSITGAPKIRAMEIIDELEPVARGPYTGALGYLGFNRESQLSILIRAAVCKSGVAHFNVGAGIVADSRPEAEYEETLTKAGGFLAALNPLRMDAMGPATVKSLSSSSSSRPAVP